MKLTKTAEIDAFRAAVDACKGDVWLVSPNGDEYHLKSVFSQCLALDALLSGYGDELQLFCARHEEEAYFFKFFHDYPEVLQPQY